MLGPLKEGLGLAESFPIAFDTDVNAPAFAEYKAAPEDVPAEGVRESKAQS